MKKKLTCVLIVDDDEPTNYLHHLIIDQANCVHNIQTTYSGQEALEYLSLSGKFQTNNMDYPQPDIIFLDINMPGITGWEFLDKYKSLKNGQKDKTVIVVLTTSPNPDEEEKAKKIPEISEYKQKPFTSKMLDDILKNYFGDHFI
jgi:CheY-like chemotaxis protein